MSGNPMPTVYYFQASTSVNSAYVSIIGASEDQSSLGSSGNLVFFTFLSHLAIFKKFGLVYSCLFIVRHFESLCCMRLPDMFGQFRIFGENIQESDSTFTLAFFFL